MAKGSEIKNSNDAKKKLKEATDAESVWSVLKQAMANLMSLEIITEITGGAESEKLETRIDLFQADRANHIHRNFLKDPDLAPMRDFHAEQVKLAEQDIKGKLELLSSVGGAIINAMTQGKDSTPSTPTSTPTGTGV